MIIITAFYRGWGGDDMAAAELRPQHGSIALLHLDAEGCNHRQKRQRCTGDKREESSKEAKTAAFAASAAETEKCRLLIHMKR